MYNRKKMLFYPSENSSATHLKRKQSRNSNKLYISQEEKSRNFTENSGVKQFVHLWKWGLMLS